MSNWTGGYVADIAYTHGYYPELNPLRIRLAFLQSGHAIPATGTACELGFGQGISTNLHAAASVTRWYGTDFNPSQAGFAQELAAASGASAQLYDEAFAQFCARADLPDFDFIGLHGIWSWISDENRGVITDFIRRKLKVGGVVYISYNTQPGWAAMAPLRDLLVEHSELMGVPGTGIVPRIDASLDFAERVFKSGALYGRANPNVVGRLEALKTQNRNYLAHEYFNRDWVPMSFSRIKGWLEEAKLSFACSAHALDHVDAINLTPEQQQLLADVPDPMFRETVRDFLVNSQFRRDYWVRGPRTLSVLERVELLRKERFVLVAPRDTVTMTVTGTRGAAAMHEDVYLPILDILQDHRIHTLHDIERALEGKADLAGIMQAMLILVGKNAVNPVHDDAAIEAAARQCQRLNRRLCLQARYSDAVSALASPVTGGGVRVSRIDQLLMLAHAEAPDNPVAWARFVLQVVHAQDQRLLVEGKAPESIEAELDEARRQTLDFQARRLPIMKALRIQL